MALDTSPRTKPRENNATGSELMNDFGFATVNIHIKRIIGRLSNSSRLFANVGDHLSVEGPIKRRRVR